GLKTAQIGSLSPEEKTKSKEDLHELADRLQQLFVQRSTLLEHLNFYIKLAKNPSTGLADKKFYWNSILVPRAQQVHDTVGHVAILGGDSDSPFKITLSGAERRALLDYIWEKGDAVSTFERMTAPISHHDILRLEGLV